MKSSFAVRRPGFTLVELLVVTGIVAALAAISVVGGKRMIGSAKASNAVQGGRELMVAYLLDASDQNGRLMPGVDPGARASYPDGRQMPTFMAKRYPARFAATLGEALGKTVCVNEAEAWAGDFYMATVYPSFGINATFVGGHFGESEPDPERDAETYGDFCIERLTDADDAARQVVFLTARSFNGHREEIPGNFLVRSPFLHGRRWDSEFDRSRAASRWGNVDPRYNGKAVGAFLDGSARVLSEEELQDMRIWAKGAREANNPKWTIGSR